MIADHDHIMQTEGRFVVFDPSDQSFATCEPHPDDKANFVLLRWGVLGEELKEKKVERTEFEKQLNQGMPPPCKAIIG